LLPAAATPGRAPAGAADGSVVLFQGDSITDAGRDRGVADPNSAGALGSGYPLLVASAALAAHPDRGLRFYNRGISGNKVPDLAARGARGRGVRPTPAGVQRPGAPQHAAILGRRWRPPHPRRPRRHRGAVASRGEAVIVGLLSLATRLAAQDAPLEAFRDNIAAIHARDRAAYLAHYLHTPALARVGPDGLHQGYEEFAQGAGAGWPDTLVATHFRVVPLTPD